MVAHIVNLLSKNESHGSKNALIYNNELYSYDELSKQVSDFMDDGALLRERGASRNGPAHFQVFQGNKTCQFFGE